MPKRAETRPDDVPVPGDGAAGTPEEEVGANPVTGSQTAAPKAAAAPKPKAAAAPKPKPTAAPKPKPKPKAAPAAASESTPADAPAPSGDARVGASPDVSTLVPGWLALTVLLLLLAVATLGGYVIRGLVTGSDANSAGEAAVVEWQRAVKADPTDVESMLNLGYAYQQEGRYEEALETYATVIELDPGNSGALYNTGMVYLALERGADAEVAFWDVLEQVPDHALAAEALGQYYIDREQYRSALVTLEPVIALRPQFADLQYLAGYACEQLGIEEQAAEYYRGALTYVPDYVEARDGLTRLGVAE